MNRHQPFRSVLFTFASFTLVALGARAAGAAPTLSVDDADIVPLSGGINGNPGATFAVFTVKLSRPDGSEVGIGFSTSNGSAVGGDACGPGIDFVHSSGEHFFEGLDTEVDLAVFLCPDSAAEQAEQFTLNVNGSFGAAIVDGQGIAFLEEHGEVGPALSVSIGNGVLTEGNLGQSEMVFSVGLSVAVPVPVSVGFSTEGSTASSTTFCLPALGGDFVAASGFVNFPAGVTLRQVRVRVCGDRRVERNERFRVRLTQAGVPIGDGLAIGLIRNDDRPVLTVENLVVQEDQELFAFFPPNSARFVLRLDQPAADPVAVVVRTRDDSARGGSSCLTSLFSPSPHEYLSSTRTIEFATGESSKTFVVPLCGDLAGEPTKRFFARLTNPEGLLLPPGDAMATIVDND